MKESKRHIILDNYDFYNGYLNVVFTLDDDKYREDIIDENSFQEFIYKCGKLEYFIDCWDGQTESHYTEEKIIDYDEWKKEVCESNDIIDFLYYFYERNKIPNYIEE